MLAEGRWFVTAPDELALTLEDREREIRALAQADNGCFLVARLPEARVAGFLVLKGGTLARTRHVARLELLVGRAWRGRGLGRALMAGAIASAERGAALRKLTLAVFADNAPALALYRSFGFVEEGRRVAEYRETDGALRDDLLMARFVR